MAAASCKKVVAVPSAEGGGGVGKPVNMQINQLKFMRRCCQTCRVHPGLVAPPQSLILRCLQATLLLACPIKAWPATRIHSVLTEDATPWGSDVLSVRHFVGQQHFSFSG